MGYACPVCETPQMDARHLANHLAFTALLGDDDHEQWLDEEVPGWESEGEAELAERVAPRAPDREFPQVFEDTVSERADESDDQRAGGLFDDGDEPLRGRRQTAPSDTVESVLAEARELTERRRAEHDDTDSDGGDSPDDGDGNG